MNETRSPQPRLLLLLGVSAILLPTSGCASWRVQESTAQEVILTHRPNRVRVTTREGERTILQEPRAIQGVLRGYDEACWDRLGERSDGCPEVGYLLSDVEVVEIRQQDRRVLILGAVGMMASLMYLVFAI